MGHIVTTPSGNYRANWRDTAGRQCAKTFKTKKAANAHLAEVESSLNRGTYVDPHAGRLRFGDYAQKWLDARNDERTTMARDASIMRIHVLPRWGDVPFVKIDHLAAQKWITELGSRLSAATVAECYRLANAITKTAMRDRIIGFNPFDGVRVPRRRRTDVDERTISRTDLIERLLPEIPARYRALVAIAGGTGLRWGECAGLRWDAVDLKKGTVRVIRTVVEVAGHVSHKPYPKSRAGRRVVPIPKFALSALKTHEAEVEPGPSGEIFTNTSGGPLRRTLFRSRVWRPALVRAGLLGQVEIAEDDPPSFVARWLNKEGIPQKLIFDSEGDAVSHVTQHAAGGLRFHDLRHSYATWLISKKVPVNVVQEVMGHEQASTTLNLYTHGAEDAHEQIVEVLADFSLTEKEESQIPSPNRTLNNNSELGE